MAIDTIPATATPTLRSSTHGGSESNRGAAFTLAAVLGAGLIVLLAEMLLSFSLASAHPAHALAHRQMNSSSGASSMMFGAPSSNIHLTILPQKPNSTIQGPAYSQTSLTVPANSLVTITIINNDPGDTALPTGSPFAHVTGVTGGVAYVDGQAYRALDVAKVAHTFTVPQLGINVPIPGDIPAGQKAITVTFSFKTGAQGMFTWQCMDPCGSGASGWGGPMATMGYMQGMIMVR